jgi:hypothetical protein
VKGRIALNGQPFKSGGGSVVFMADTTKGNTTKHEPRGTLSPDGDFELTTIGQPGAPAGWYKVLVLAQDPSSSSNPYAVPKYIVPTEYTTVERTPLSVEVVAKPSAGAYDLDVKKK